MRVRALLVLVLLPALAVAQESRQASGTPPGSGSKIRVGSWNMDYWIDEARQLEPSQTAADLARYIADSRVAVLGLQRASRQSVDGSWTFDRLSDVFQQVSRLTGGQWQHRVFPAFSGKNIHAGIAWDESRVTLVQQQEPWPVPVKHGEGPSVELVDERGRPTGAVKTLPLWYRPPHAVKFSAGPGLTDFVVISIHMKSNRDGDFSDHRVKEAEQLVAAIADVRTFFQDDDIIIIGAWHTFDRNAARVFDKAGYVNLNPEQHSTRVRFGAKGMDLGGVRVPADQPEFKHRYFEVFGHSWLHANRLSTKDFFDRFSDDFIYFTEFAIGPDDD